MNTDSAFAIGTTHRVCQDHAVSGEGYAIISDGCSMAPMSDFGSRLWTHAASIQEHPFDWAKALQMVISWRKEMKLPEESIYATLMAVEILKDCFRVFVAGDGVVVARTKKGEIKIIDYDYPTNAPFYPAYLGDDSARELYEKQYGIDVVITNYRISGEAWLGDGCEISSQAPPFFSVFSLDEYDLVAVFSDGIRSFYEIETRGTSKTSKSVPFLSPLTELLNYKNYNGKFVQRRFKKAFSSFAEKCWHNADDLSMGVVYRSEE